MSPTAAQRSPHHRRQIWIFPLTGSRRIGPGAGRAACTVAVDLQHGGAYAAGDFEFCIGSDVPDSDIPVSSNWYTRRIARAQMEWREFVYNPMQSVRCSRFGPKHQAQQKRNRHLLCLRADEWLDLAFPRSPGEGTWTWRAMCSPLGLGPVVWT